MFDQTKIMLNHIKKDKPLILNITNYVTMDFIANGLLSLGASPVMSQSAAEIEDLLGYTKAVVINFGTLDDNFINLCKETARLANQYHIPIVFDPVGAGASQYRRQHCAAFINDFKLAVIRGNASEIRALSCTNAQTKGVDSSEAPMQAVDSAKMLAHNKKNTVSISGPTDIIIDSNRHMTCSRGSHWMPSITGTGCLLNAVIAAFLAVHNDAFFATTLATFFYGICGEIAAKNALGPGSFKTQFLDALSFYPERSHYDNA